MKPVIVYDPNHRHQPLGSDPGVLFVRVYPDFRNAISADDGFIQVIHLCCSDPSARIAEVRQSSQRSIINKCKQHSGPETNPLFDRNVRDDIRLDRDGDYEFASRVLRMEANNKYGLTAEFMCDVEQLERIAKQGLNCVTQISVEASVSNRSTTNTVNQSEEAE